MICGSRVCHPHPSTPTLTHLVCQPCHTHAVVATGRGEARHVSAVVRPARTRALPPSVTTTWMETRCVGTQAADTKAAV
jgi:hypothetical protein